MLLIHAYAVAQAFSQEVVTQIDRSMKLQAGRVYGQLVVTASNIVIDGNGVSLKGPGGKTDARKGVAIRVEGVSNVTIKNLNASGWETGLSASHSTQLTIQNCDFSDNFHAPEFGWGENGRRGGIYFESVVDSSILDCRAQRVWDACILVDSHRVQIRRCDFSHTSNTGLKLWQATQNQIENNDFSYGIRKDPGEVHARDSTCVLIESGSDDNVLRGNDCTHGGDGIFVRVLNGWCSSGNLFEQNDCSYANNNGIECWAPENAFLSNKANYCSYGFWLGGSDKTILIGNEASFNGLDEYHHNSPHLPNEGHAGIVFMFGPSSHVLARDNRCVGNNGAGIALVGDLKSQGRAWKAYHWVLEDNLLAQNRWGVFMQFADWVTTRNNRFMDNTIADWHQESAVTRFRQLTPIDVPQNASPLQAGATVDIDGPMIEQTGQPRRFAVSLTGENKRQDRADRQYAWGLDQLTLDNATEFVTTFDETGFHRLGVNVINTNSPIAIGWRDLYIVDGHPELGEEASQWSLLTRPGLGGEVIPDLEHKVVGQNSARVLISPYDGGTAEIQLPGEGSLNIPFRPESHLSFWIKAINPNLHGWQDANPIVDLIEAPGRSLQYSTDQNLLNDPKYNEARAGWRLITIPLTPNDPDGGWQRTGAAIRTINQVRFRFDSWDSQPLQIWIDGCTIE